MDASEQEPKASEMNGLRSRRGTHKTALVQGKKGQSGCLRIKGKERKNIYLASLRSKKTMT